MDAFEPSSETYSFDLIPHNRESQIRNDSNLHQVEVVPSSYPSRQSKHTTKEEEFFVLQHQNGKLCSDLRHQLSEIKASSQVCEDESFEKFNDENQEKEKIWSKESLRLAKECLVRAFEILDGPDGDKPGIAGEGRKNSEGGLKLFEEFGVFLKLANALELKLCKYKETKVKEKRQLENSMISLTEENRDITTLLRIALAEKEGVQKDLNRLKGNNEQKNFAILQIAERGLQKVGFGFIMGTGVNEPSFDNSGASTSCEKSSDSSESEEEVINLVSTVEKIMKNLRLEITQLRRLLEEARSDTERLQSLVEKQAQEIKENTMYINELEDRQMVLAQNVEDLLKGIKETEEEVHRWRKACEMEAEAGKNTIKDRDEVVAIMKLELEKTKAALQISKAKLKLKEELESAAMAAQASAERSLILTDSRVAGLYERIEELTAQLEQAEKQEKSKRMIRHICWPWRPININPDNKKVEVRNPNQRLPEMQALLQ